MLLVKFSSGRQLDRPTQKINEMQYDVTLRHQIHFACSVVDWYFEQNMLNNFWYSSLTLLQLFLY